MREVRKRKLKPSVVEKELGLSNGYMATMEKRNGNMGEDVLVKFSEYLNFSLNYIIRGEEETLDLVKEPSVTYQSTNKEVHELKDQIQILKGALADKQKIIKLLEERSVHTQKKAAILK